MLHKNNKCTTFNQFNGAERTFASAFFYLKHNAPPGRLMVHIFQYK